MRSVRDPRHTVRKAETLEEETEAIGRKHAKRFTMADEFEMPKARNCGAVEVLHSAIESDPTMYARLAAIESATQSRLFSADLLKDASEIVIPVVVHVVYKTAAENISDAQINSQIEILNTDFGAWNNDQQRIPNVWRGLSIDSRIRFALAG